MRATPKVGILSPVVVVVVQAALVAQVAQPQTPVANLKVPPTLVLQPPPGIIILAVEEEARRGELRAPQSMAVEQAVAVIMVGLVPRRVLVHCLAAAEAVAGEASTPGMRLLLASQAVEHLVMDKAAAVLEGLLRELMVEQEHKILT